MPEVVAITSPVPVTTDSTETVGAVANVAPEAESVALSNSTTPTLRSEKVHEINKHGIASGSTTTSTSTETQGCSG